MRFRRRKNTIVVKILQFRRLNFKDFGSDKMAPGCDEDAIHLKNVGFQLKPVLLPLISMAPWPLVFDRRRRSRSRSRSGSLIAGVGRRQRCQRICRCSTATKAVAETAGGDWRSVREITGAVPKAVKQRIKQFSSCPGLTKPGISMCSSQDELLGTPDAVSKRVWRSTFPTPSFGNLRHPSCVQFSSGWRVIGFRLLIGLLSLLVYNPLFELPVWKIRIGDGSC